MTLDAPLQPLQVAGRMSLSTKDFLAGAVAGALSIMTTHPLDTVRVRMQTPQLVSGGAGVPALSKATSGILACMVRKEGALSPFKGMSFPVALASLQSALIFHVYGSTLRFVSSPRGPGQGHDEAHGGLAASDVAVALPTVGQAFVAGSTAGLAQVALWSPIEMLKIRMQLQTCRPGSPGYVGPWRMLRHILATEGVTGLYRGITVTALRDMPSYGVYFASYRALASWCEPGVAPEDASASTQIVAGGSAGCIAWMSIYPLDVIKSRMQAAARNPSNSGLTFLDYAAAIYKEGGSGALWRGIQPTLARAFVMDAVSFLGYTNVLRLLKDS